MTTEEILKALAHEDNKFPREALQQAVASKDEITPHLLKILEQAADDPTAMLEENDSSYLYAIFLLAQFREKRAYPLIVKLASHPPSLVDELLGETITEDLHNILASVSLGDTSLIVELAANKKADDFVRGAALRSWLTLVACGEKSREETMAYYQSLFDGGLTDEDDLVWSELVECAVALYPEEVYERIKQVIKVGLIDKFIVDLDEVNEKMAAGQEKALAELPENHHLIKDTIATMEWWAWYWESGEDEDEDEDWEDDEDWDDDDLYDDDDWDDETERISSMNGNLAAPRMPYRAPEKIGRNDPCPCGSGKKYKKCCGASSI